MLVPIRGRNFCHNLGWGFWYIQGDHAQATRECAWTQVKTGVAGRGEKQGPRGGRMGNQTLSAHPDISLPCRKAILDQLTTPMEK